jgi:hypothetical protein
MPRAEGLAAWTRWTVDRRRAFARQIDQRRAGGRSDDEGGSRAGVLEQVERAVVATMMVLAMTKLAMLS